MRDFLRSPIARVWVPVLGLTAGRAYLDRGTDPGDLIYFVHRGEQLLSGGWANTFSDPVLQSGPLQLVLFGAVRNLTALAFVLELAVAALLLFVLGKLQVGDRIRLLVGVLAVAAVFPPVKIGCSTQEYSLVCQPGSSSGAYSAHRCSCWHPG